MGRRENSEWDSFLSFAATALWISYTARFLTLTHLKAIITTNHTLVISIMYNNIRKSASHIASMHSLLLRSNSFLKLLYSDHIWSVWHGVLFLSGPQWHPNSSYTFIFCLFQVCQVCMPEENLKYFWALVIAYTLLFFFFFLFYLYFLLDSGLGAQ